MKILIILLIFTFTVLTIAYFMIGNYFFNIALNPNTSKEFVLGGTEEIRDDGNRRRLANQCESCNRRLWLYVYMG